MTPDEWAEGDLADMLDVLYGRRPAGARQHWAPRPMSQRCRLLLGSAVCARQASQLPPSVRGVLSEFTRRVLMLSPGDASPEYVVATPQMRERLREVLRQVSKPTTRSLVSAVAALLECDSNMLPTVIGYMLERRRRAAAQRARRAVVQLIRDVHGDPWRLLRLSPGACVYCGQPLCLPNCHGCARLNAHPWMTRDVVNILTAVHAEFVPLQYTYERVSLNALSDALEDAGCDDAELLAHLRSAGPHVPGCWAIDVLRCQ